MESWPWHKVAALGWTLLLWCRRRAGRYLFAKLVVILIANVPRASAGLAFSFVGERGRSQSGQPVGQGAERR